MNGNSSSVYFFIIHVGSRAQFLFVANRIKQQTPAVDVAEFMHVGDTTFHHQTLAEVLWKCR